MKIFCTSAVHAAKYFSYLEIFSKQITLMYNLVFFYPLLMDNTVWYLLNGLRILVFSNTFNNISVISWQSFLFFEETEYMQKIIDLLQFTDKLRAIPFKYT